MEFITAPMNLSSINQHLETQDKLTIDAIMIKKGAILCNTCDNTTAFLRQDKQYARL